MALARANEITGNQTYLQKAIEGFNHVWEGSYEKVDGGMFWDFKHINISSQSRFLTWVQKNVNTGWQNRDTDRILPIVIIQSVAQKVIYSLTKPAV